ncbi:MAG: UDP-glucose 4-epimerase GalE [Ilumatobacteraceae bacterium]
MTILVTGGAGYIGSHTVRMLRSQGRDVVVLDSLEYGHRDALLGAELVVGNIRDRDLVTKACRDHGVDQVVHFAAYKSVGESMEQPAKYWMNNVAGSVDLVEALLAAGVRDIVFSSSCSVNGNPPTVPVTEDMPIAPESVYAETKAMVEKILGWYGVTSGLRAVSLRYFNAAGASADAQIGEDWTQSLNLIPLVMKATLGKRPAVQVFGNDYPTPDGTCIRDYIHVDDLAEAHIKALDHLAGGGATVALNVGTGVGSSVMDVIHATERVSGMQVPYEVVGRRAGDPVATYADPTKVEATLDWRATHDLDAIVASAWAWHSTHLDGYGD